MIGTFDALGERPKVVAALRTELSQLQSRERGFHGDPPKATSTLGRNEFQANLRPHWRGSCKERTMLRTPLCRLLSIEVPILAAPMGFITGPELAAEVSNAGGLGIMSFSGNPPPVLRDEIRKLRSLTNKPFGIGVLLSGPHLPFPVEAIVEVCLEERVPVLLTFWGDPTSFVARAHAVGTK
ncbi:MAG: nitronate monooxygenase, partial [Methyloceanibacter sp.]